MPLLERIAFKRLFWPIKVISIVFPFTVTFKGSSALASALLFKKREWEMMVSEPPFNLIAEPLVALFPVKLQFSISPLFPFHKTAF